MGTPDAPANAAGVVIAEDIYENLRRTGPTLKATHIFPRLGLSVRVDPGLPAGHGAWIDSTGKAIATFAHGNAEVER